MNQKLLKSIYINNIKSENQSRKIPYEQFMFINVVHHSFGNKKLKLYHKIDKKNLPFSKSTV